MISNEIIVKRIFQVQPIDAIKALPKVEQHVHILGSIRPETLLRVIDETGIETPYSSLEDIKKRFEFRDFSHFLDVYNEVIDIVTEEKYFETMTFELLENNHRCNVKYTEVSFSPSDHIQCGLDFELTMDAIERGIKKAKQTFGIYADIRIDLVRKPGSDSAMKILDQIERRPEGIVSIDMGGPEDAFPAEHYKEVYGRALAMGLHRVVHAGEALGPESIWDAIRHLHVERIGHGVSAIRDPPLMKYLREKNIILEICPISNIRTRVVPSMSEHPIREFVNRGLSVTVSSDDPSFFATDMNNEYIQLHKHLGFTLEELFQISLNGVNTLFITEDDKEKWRKIFHSEYNKIIDGLE